MSTTLDRPDLLDLDQTTADKPFVCVHCGTPNAYGAACIPCHVSIAGIDPTVA